MEFIQLVINGLLLRGVYVLLGLGMSIIFGIVGLTNLAHGEFVVLGAYASTLIAGALGVDPLLTLLLTLPVMFCLGAGLQILLINRAMKKGGEVALLVTFGISIMLQDGMLLLFSADARHAEASYSLSFLRLWRLNISTVNLAVFAVCMVFVLGLTLFLNHTYTGRAIRAVSDDHAAARLCGISIDRIYAIAMGTAMAMAAAAGCCVSLKWTFYPSSGGRYLLISFVVVIIGGMGSVFRTLVAGLLFGLVQVIGGASTGLVISYAALLLILAFSPKRYLNEGQREREDADV